MNRHDIVTATERASDRTQKASRCRQCKSVNGIEPKKMLIMAWGFDNSLRELEPNCTAFSLVHEDAVAHSSCVAAYGKEPEWPTR